MNVRPPKAWPSAGVCLGRVKGGSEDELPADFRLLMGLSHLESMECTKKARFFQDHHCWSLHESPGKLGSSQLGSIGQTGRDNPQD